MKSEDSLTYVTVLLRIQLLYKPTNSHQHPSQLGKSDFSDSPNKSNLSLNNTEMLKKHFSYSVFAENAKNMKPQVS